MPLHVAGDVTPQQFLQAGGRITHMRRGRKVATIAYWTDPEHNIVYYGAVIFDPDDTDPVFTHKIRKQHNQWAVDRLMTAPVRKPDPFAGWTGDGQVEYQRRHYIRNQLMPFYSVCDVTNHDIDVLQLMLRNCL